MASLPPPTAEAIELLVQQLEAVGDANVRAEQHEHEQHVAELRHHGDRAAEMLAEGYAAAERLGALTTPGAMLVAAPRELCQVGDLHRVVLSSVRDGLLTAEALTWRDEPDAADAALEQLRAEPLRLSHRLVETDAVRRRHTGLVKDVSTAPVTASAMGAVLRWTAYVVAPIVVGTEVIALVHADRGPGMSIDAAHRDAVSAFAVELSRTYETASLRRSLRHEREQIRQFIDWLDARSHDLSTAEITLAPMDLSAPAPGRDASDMPARSDRNDTNLHGLLTRRELEVLRLVANGLSNQAIADTLVVSVGTAKSHVHRILSKLHTANRAEAVARYYALTPGPHRR